MQRFFRGCAAAAALAAVTAVAPGCTSTTVIDASSTPAKRAGEQIRESLLLDVGVAIFDPGLDMDSETLEKNLIDPSVRSAEAAYLAYNLRNTLEETENWGAVRIMPRPTEAIDLMVYGEIVESTGIELVLKVRAVDATGEEWLSGKYKDMASQLSYRDEIAGDEDAFQDIYNLIADDLLEAYLARTEKDISRIRKTAMLRFAEDVAPYAFDDYVEKGDDGVTEIRRLPADGDPMLARVEKIREREYMFIDLLDEHYKGFHSSMSQPYSDWRQYTYQELTALRDLKKAALATKLIGAATVVGGIAVRSNADSREEQIAGNAAILGGAAIVKTGFDIGAESKIHAAAVRELGESFRTELEPMVVEVEGRTTELSGTAEQQFDKWRTLLRDIYRKETGIDLQEGGSEPALPELKVD